jgi:hypothetical protein
MTSFLSEDSESKGRAHRGQQLAGLTQTNQGMGLGLLLEGAQRLPTGLLHERLRFPPRHDLCHRWLRDQDHTQAGEPFAAGRGHTRQAQGSSRAIRRTKRGGNQRGWERRWDHLPARPCTLAVGGSGTRSESIFTRSREEEKYMTTSLRRSMWSAIFAVIFVVVLGASTTAFAPAASAHGGLTCDPLPPNPGGNGGGYVSTYCEGHGIATLAGDCGSLTAQNSTVFNHHGGPAWVDCSSAGTTGPIQNVSLHLNMYAEDPPPEEDPCP